MEASEKDTVKCSRLVIFSVVDSFSVQSRDELNWLFFVSSGVHAEVSDQRENGTCHQSANRGIF